MHIIETENNKQQSLRNLDYRDCTEEINDPWTCNNA